MEVSGQLHSLAALTSGKKPSVPIGYEAVFLKSQSGGRGGEEKKSLPLSEIEPRSSIP
jgi:hypothetical protein